MKYYIRYATFVNIASCMIIIRQQYKTVLMYPIHNIAEHMAPLNLPRSNFKNIGKSFDVPIMHDCVVKQYNIKKTLKRIQSTRNCTKEGNVKKAHSCVFY